MVAAAALSRSPARRDLRRAQRRSRWSAALLGPLAASWLALGIVDSIAGALGGLVSKPVDWARSMIQGVVSWVSDWLNHVIDWAGRAFDAIDGVIRQLWDFGNSIVTWAHGLMVDVYDRLTGWVGGLIRDVRGWVTGWINHVIDWVSGMVGDLWDYARGTVDWVNRNIWQPLSDRIDGAVNWVENNIVPWLGNLVGDLRGWATSAFDHVWGWLGDTLQPWIGWAQGLLHLVEGAAGWLAWIAQRPYDWFVAMWHHLADSHPDTLEAMVTRAFESSGTRLEDAVVRWFE